MKQARMYSISGIFFFALMCGNAVGQGKGASDESKSARRITLNIAKGEIGDALRLVAEQGGLNLVIGPEVKGNVSVYLTDASLTSALKAIAVNNGFQYIVEDGVIAVSKPLPKDTVETPPPMITRIFNLQSQDAERVRDALEFALSKYGRIKVLNQNSQLGYGIQRLSNLSGDINSGSSGSSNGTTSVSSTSGSSGGQNGSTATNGSSFGPGGGMQSADQARSSRTLVVTDTKENVERVSELIADLDKLPPQVLIEARIVEMGTDLQRQLGIDWNINALATGPTLNHEWPLRNRAGFATGTQIRRRPDGTAEASAGLALGTIDFSQFTALLQANQNDTAIRLLANPRLLVYNNHSASILVGERYPILRANITDFGTVTEAFDTYIPVGVQLEVTPTIMMDGTISLMVHPATSALGDDVVGTTGLHIARILTREIDTRVLMKDGQTIVLGGLISDRKTRSIEKVPGLGDLPILDIFFRSESPQTQRTDLLIFLTAHIEGALEISERDHQVFDMYKPVFKHMDRLQDVQLHFEIPTEFEWPKPMFGDPPESADEHHDEAAVDEEQDETASADEPEAKSDETPAPASDEVEEKKIIHEQPTKTTEPPVEKAPPTQQPVVEEKTEETHEEAAPESDESDEDDEDDEDDDEDDEDENSDDDSEKASQQNQAAALTPPAVKVAEAPAAPTIESAPECPAPRLLTVVVAPRAKTASTTRAIWKWLKNRAIAQYEFARIAKDLMVRAMTPPPEPVRRALANSGARLDD